MFEAYGYMLVPMIVALVSVANMLGVPPRYLPLVSLFLGIAAGITYTSPADLKQGVLEGIIMGLSAVGLWSSVKNTIGK